MEQTTLQIRRVSLDSIHLDPANARAHGERNLEAIKGSLVRFGQQKPIVVGPSGIIIAGNGTYEAARSLGWESLQVVETDLEGLEATAFAIADNRTSDLSEFDPPALAQLLEQLRKEDALAGVGFDDTEIDDLLAELQADLDVELDDPGPQEPPEEPVTKLGDLWVLGDHRLLCGDSTRPEDVARLMDGQTASLLATDPPYLVDYRGADQKDGHDTGEEHWDDYHGDEHGLEFFRTWLTVALRHCVEAVPVYQWHGHKRASLVEQAWKDTGLLVHQQIIWSKPRGVMTRSHYLWAHEPCFYGWPQGSMPPKARRPPANATTIWDLDQPHQSDRIHVTQKPVEIFLRPIESHTRPGEIALEPFSGSGTQLIAAERCGRRCFAMELSPAFVDASIERWQKATGKQAVHEDGHPFRRES